MKSNNYIKKGSYDKRLDFLKSKWDDLMVEQSKMSMEQIIEDGFQARKKRIAALYQRANEEDMRERRDAIKKILEYVSPLNTNSMVNLPTGIISFNL